MSATIIIMPGVERRDLAGSPAPSENILEAALEAGVTDAIVVGRDRSGELYIAGAPPDVDRCVGMLMRAVTVLSESKIVNDVEIGTDPPCA